MTMVVADAFVPNNLKSAVKLQKFVAIKDIYCLSSVKDNAWILLFCINTSSYSGRSACRFTKMELSLCTFFLVISRVTILPGSSL